MEQSRTTKSARNAIYGMTGLLINIVISFVAKSIFITCLGNEYNGLNGLFSNILSVLNLAELGFAGSIAFTLYKPLQNGNEREIAAIMNYYAKVYRTIALVVLVVGAAVIPFLQYLINEDISELSFNINELRIFYSLYLLNTVCSYLLSYKRTIIRADQNAYIISLVDNVGNILLNIVQIVLLILTKNYYAFLVVMVAKTLLNNIIIHIIASKKYKYLGKYKKEKITKEEKSYILKNVRAMMLHNIGGVAIGGTTSLVISAFVSVVEAGMYGNYLMIVNNVAAFINIIFTSMTASIGNLCVEKDEEEQYKVFRRINYLACMCGVFVFSCMIALFQPFITVWIGEDNLLPVSTVIVISFSAMVGNLRNAVLDFRTAKGLFVADRYKPLIEAALGVGLSIGLSYVLGITGVVLGYTMATFLFAFPVENYVLFKKGFHKSMPKQMLHVLATVLFAFLVAFVNYFIVGMVGIAGWGGFVLKLIISVAVSITMIVAFTMNTPEFKYFWGVFLGIGKAIGRKIKKILQK